MASRCCFSIQVNFPPYIFEADLLHAVDDVSSTATVGDGKVKFILKRADSGDGAGGSTWGELVLKDVDKATLRARREQSQEDSFKRQEEDKKTASDEATKRQVIKLSKLK